MVDWIEIGRRVQEARISAGLSQEALASRVSLERTALSKIETGKRRIDSLELARLAIATGRPVGWFLRERPPAVLSRKEAIAASATNDDLLLEDLADDVKLLVELKVLHPMKGAGHRAQRFRSYEDVEQLANRARKLSNMGRGPLDNIVGLAESLGLLVFILELPKKSFLGTYISLPEAGVALVDGGLPVGQLRFTIAHELGHHFVQDEFDVLLDTDVGRGTRERLIDAFAAYLLMPRAGIEQRWKALHQKGHDDRAAAIHIGHEYGVSWSALCAHLKNLGLIGETGRRRLAGDTPGKAEFMEHGLLPRHEIVPPILPPGFSRAVITAYKRRLLGGTRAVELLRGAVEMDDLPELRQMPLDAMRKELEPIE